MSPPVADSTKQDESKASQRRINKPLIEKRRRARINDCLSQLKSIVLEAQESQTPRPSKLEKADILEMTVEFIKKKTASSDGEENQQRGYLAGYTGCLTEISKFLAETNGISSELRESIVNHMKQQMCDSNNNFSQRNQKTGESSEVKQEKLPISRDPAKPMKVNKEISASEIARTSTKNASPCISDTDKKDLTHMQYKNLQQSSAGLLCGGQVLLVLQLPPTQNMTVPQPVPLPVYTAPSNLSALQSLSAIDNSFVNNYCGFDTSKHSSDNAVASDRIPQQSTQKRMDDPSAIFPSNNAHTGSTTSNITDNADQISPLNLCTNRQKCNDPSTADTWRPW